MGDTEIEEELDSDSSEFDFFNDFLSPDVYDKLYQECKRAKGYSFKKYAKGFFEKNRPENWTKRLIDDSEDMINSWPGRRNSATSDQVRKLFECLGFDIQQAFKATGRTEELFQVVVTPTPKNRADYVHPIAAFGTQVKSPVNAIIGICKFQLFVKLSSLLFCGSLRFFNLIFSNYVIVIITAKKFS